MQGNKWDAVFKLWEKRKGREEGQRVTKNEEEQVLKVTF